MFKKADPRIIREIEIGKDSYVDYLYGCFRCINPHTNDFSLIREIELIPGMGKIKISVPQNETIHLPENKVIRSDQFTIEPIGDRYDVMFLLSLRAGWNQTEADIKRLIDSNPTGNFLATIKDKSISIASGTAAVTCPGKQNAWIGMVLVHPELRRQGIATMLTLECMKWALNNNKIIIGLDATPTGKSVYKSLGFKESYRIWRSLFPLAQYAEKRKLTNIREISQDDFDDLVQYDASHFFERKNVLISLYNEFKESCLLHRDDNEKIKGYIFARPGRNYPFIGPLIADSMHIAEQLIAAISYRFLREGYTHAMIDIPEKSFAEPQKHRFIKNITCLREFIRMYLSVDDDNARELTKEFITKEKLDHRDSLAQTFRAIMEKAISVHSMNQAFLEYEKNTLQNKIWAISGPEKG